MNVCIFGVTKERFDRLETLTRSHFSNVETVFWSRDNGTISYEDLDSLDILMIEKRGPTAEETELLQEIAEHSYERYPYGPIIVAGSYERLQSFAAGGDY